MPPGTRVLVVDDEVSILESTRLLLIDLGYEVAVASDANRILTAMREERPEVVLQDVRMPGLDIRALLAALRSDPELRRIPVVLFSASMELGTLQEEVDAAAHLEKPFRPAEVVATIERVVRGRLPAAA